MLPGGVMVKLCDGCVRRNGLRAGGSFYLPKRPERLGLAAVRALRAQGKSVARIAKHAEVTERRVYQMLAQGRH